VNQPKYQQVADRIRAEIADGTLLPGTPAPSGAALARATGYSTLTCRRALRILIKDGALVPGVSENSRPRVNSHARTSREQAVADAAHALSSSLATRRRAAGLTQPELAAIVGVSTTTIGHAETGRLWQSRRFWEQADKGLDADGELLALHDAYRAAPVASTRTTATRNRARAKAEPPPAARLAVSGLLTCVTITWADGAVTTVYPPHSGGNSQDVP
jgi:DNA-binding transcriptional regulator YhcF (GntR family)